MPQLNNNQYAALAGDEDDEENDTKNTGVDNEEKTTRVHHDNRVIRVDSNNESTGVKSESLSMGETDKMDERNSLRRPYQKQSGILRKQLIY